MNQQPTIAYFSMEIALDPGMPTYSGGLGVLAGDTIRAAADLKVPMVGVTLLHRKGYFHQRLDPSGVQREEPAEWVVERFLTRVPQKVTINLDGKSIQLACWEYKVTGIGGYTIPVYFLDADLPGNPDWERTLTHFLYGGDDRYRLCQEAILGIGGVKILRTLGYEEIQRFHMNEGHASLLSLELLEEEARKNGRASITHEEYETVKRKCIFTTHTPVPAGHDRFPIDVANQILGTREVFADLTDLLSCDGFFNMTHLALNLSQYVNGVAQKHGEISRQMFTGHDVDAITNGVHGVTWTAEPFQELFDRYIAGWRHDNFNLRHALSIPKTEVWGAHHEAKKRLLNYVNRKTGAAMDADVLTIGFARRAAEYKRGDLLLQETERLNHISAQSKGLQVIYGGKAHPRDQAGKNIIKRIFQARESLNNEIKVVYLENYDVELGRMITSGVDVWLNTPQPPLEASGTSGMKAALNGVPSLSVLDGWWIEGCIEGLTGWAISEKGRDGQEINSSDHASALYDKLEQVVMPMYYQDRERFIDVMLHAIALNGSYFNTHRMVQQYVLKAYF